jgi:peptide/nickel transport system substrate-binding protein
MRRLQLILPLLALLALIVGGCGAPAAQPSAPAAAEQPAAQPQPVAVAGQFSEAPMLAAKVAAGELPAVDERLPANPMVIEPFDEIGTYGGDLRFGFVGNNPGWGGLWYINGWENLVRWKPDFSGIDPNIAESWEVSDDARSYTFKLREGMKWSDGEPFTADDILFYIEDVLFDPDISPAGPVADWLPNDGATEFKAEKIDDYTVKFTFARPNGFFLSALPTWAGRHITWFPKHYLAQYHKKYNPDVETLAANTEGVKDWVGLFNKMAAGPTDDIQNFFNMPERPHLFPYVITQPLGTGTTIVLERNPYYWKVDTAGNQLPYIDRIVGASYQDAESRTFAMLNGDLDYLKDPGDDNRVLYFDAMDEGRPIAINNVIAEGANTQSIHFNRTVADPVKAEVFANKDFRIGMSYAINRPEIIEIVYQGQGEPAQVAPLESSPLYNEQLATQFIEYDVALANEYLDKVLPNKDAEGYRLGPDGNRFTIVLAVSNDLSYGTNWVQVAELLTKYWNAVGVDVKLNSMPDVQFTEILKNNTVEAALYTGEGGAGLTAILDPRYYVPMETFGLFGNGWFAWRNGLQDRVQVEPPQEIKDIRALYEEVIAAPTEAEQIAKMQEVLQIAADNFWVIGISRAAPGYQPYHARIGNMPAEWVGGWIEGVNKIKVPEQWYLKE